MKELKETFSGKLKWYERIFTDCDDDTGYYINGDNLSTHFFELIDKYENKNVKITISIEEAEDE